MCLLDRVLAWDSAAIRCEASSHLDPDNPLRRAGRLRAAAGIEYATQAMALHCALTAAPGSQPGYLLSLRDVRCEAVGLDAAGSPLQVEVEAERLMGDGSSAVYAFAVRAGSVTLVTGRAAVALR
jgi:predicted hotdog family 3-hydroxylacyl-ACP dehydratase